MAIILVSEDDPRIRRVCGIWLAHRGHEVLEAENGRAAMDLLADRKVDLLVSDMQMPEVHGLELVTWWRRKRQGRCPVILLTAAGHTDEVRAQVQDLEVTVMGKPFSPVQLVDTVECLLQAHAAAVADTDEVGS